MQYRNFGNTGIKLSVLGLGAMRLPVIEGSYGNIDIAKANDIIQYAVKNGINYFDTGFTYHDGNSEIILGEALKASRKNIFISDKLPWRKVKTNKDLDDILELQLKKLNTKYIDFYLVHNIHKSFWKERDKFKLLKWFDKIKKEKKILYLGFSFHGNYETFKELLSGYNWDFCMIQYNYLNENIQVGSAGLKYAYKNNFPVFIMEPLLGGLLAHTSSLEMKEMWNKIKLTPPDTALQWLWNKPEITTVLSGMNTIKELKTNIISANNSAIGSLSLQQKKAISLSIKLFNKYNKIPCTKCNYCVQICPKNILISEILSAYNLYNKYCKLYHKLYAELNDNNKANKCINCNKCKNICPQNIDIPNWLPILHKHFNRK